MANFTIVCIMYFLSFLYENHFHKKNYLAKILYNNLKLKIFLIFAGSDGLSLLLVGHSLETRLDWSYRTSRVTLLALQEIKTGIFLQDGVRRPTSMTCNIFLDVSPKYIFYLFLLESSLDDQLTITVNTS